MGRVALEAALRAARASSGGREDPSCTRSPLPQAPPPLPHANRSQPHKAAGTRARAAAAGSRAAHL